MKDEALASLVEPDGDVLKRMIYVELVDRVVERMNRLPVQQATVFRMSYLERLSIQETCEHLGTTTDAVYFARSKHCRLLKSCLNKRM